MLQGMTVLSHGSPNSSFSCQREGTLFLGISTVPVSAERARVYEHFVRGRGMSQRLSKKELFNFPGQGSLSMTKKVVHTVPRDSSSSNTSGRNDDSSDQSEQTPFGYTRKDVLLIGLGVTLFGFGLKSGLEFAGFDPLQAGNVVQLVLVLGLTLGWISTYMFRVSNKDMTYAQQLRDYENKVMQKRLESLTEAELEALLEQVEEEKSRPASGG